MAYLGLELTSTVNMGNAASRWQVLRNKQQFGAVMQQGQVVARSRHFALHALRWRHAIVLDARATLQPPETLPSRKPERVAAVFPAALAAQIYCGAIVPKRWARRAVTRNLIKRQIRHAMLAHVPTLPGGLALVVRQREAFSSDLFVSASSAALRAAVRHELAQLFGKTDWQALAGCCADSVI